MVTLEHLQMRLGSHRAKPADMSGRAQASVALVFAPGGEAGPELLLIRRAEVEGDPWSGHMGFPGGRREDGDEDLLATACRETEEETGIGLEDRTLIGVLDDLAPMRPMLPPIAIRPFVFALDAAPPIRPSPEVAAHIWAPLTSIVESAGEAKVTIAGAKIVRPAFVLGPYTVWGITYHIINNLIEIATV